MEKVRQFLETLRTDPKAQELIQALGRPQSEKDSVAGYYAVAKKLGFDIPKKEFVQGMKEIALEQKAKSEEAARVALSDSELENVAGGVEGIMGCNSTYNDNEWCWISDSCNFLITDYSAHGRDPEGPRDSFWDPRDDEIECENLADWEELELD